MGSHSQNALGNLLIGSVATHVMAIYVVQVLLFAEVSGGPVLPSTSRLREKKAAAARFFSFLARTGARFSYVLFQNTYRTPIEILN